MSGYILVLNCGSSSVKFNLFELLSGNTLQPYLAGIAEEIGSVSKSRLKYEHCGDKQALAKPLVSHGEALRSIFDLFNHLGIDKQMILAVGHRVVHGGDRYSASVLVDQHVLQTIRNLIPIAPLHNPPNLTGLEESIRLLKNVPQVAVFDTAFHETLPEYAYRYAIPAKWYEQYGVRKYGFHGTSHMYVAKRAARLLGIPFRDFYGITAHLGNGCSITKVCGGRSLDTSMGFTPLEGVVMGTRSGDIDPALIPYVANCLAGEQSISQEKAFECVMTALNKESGLKALYNTNMMQEIRARAEAGDLAAQTVIDIYAYRIAKYIGQYWATMPRADALVFTAGLGENEGHVRRKILNCLENLVFIVDEAGNACRGQEVVIGRSDIKPGRPLVALVIPTNEELVIGYDTLYLGHLRQQLPDIYPFEQ